ncbi:hypothetical protein ACVWYH_007220 [Bradyrhizobium sp. GM24.11]
MDVTDPELKEAFGLMRSQMDGASAKTSNLLWKTVGQVLEPKVRTALSQREPSFVAAGQAGLVQLAAWFEKRVRQIVMELLTEELAEDEKTAGHLERTLRRRCEFAGKYCLWKGKPGRRTAHRGRDRDCYFGTESAKERRQVSSKRTGEHRTFIASWELLTVLTPIGRQADRPIAHLAGFKGILQVGGYAGYDKLAERGEVQLAFCWSQMRRNFYETSVPRPSQARRFGTSPSSTRSRRTEGHSWSQPSLAAQRIAVAAKWPASVPWSVTRGLSKKR